MDKTDGKKKQYFLSKERQQEILRKLENSNIKSEEQYRKIVQNLEQQNVRLRDELKVTGDKVLKLLEKKKVVKTQNHHTIEKEIIARKVELQTKYKEFDQFKKDVQEGMSKKEDPQIKGQLNRIDSETKHLERQLKSIREERRMLEVTNRDLVQALAEFTKDESPDKQRLELLQKQNRQLKKRATEERKKDDNMDHESIRVQQSMVALQQKIRKAKEKERQVPKSLKSIKAMELSDRSEIVSSTLAKQVLELKAKKNQLIDQQEARKNELTKKRNALLENNQHLWSKAKRLEVDKTMLLQEINKYEAFLGNKESQSKKVKQVPKHAETQTDQISQLFRLRRDYAGTLGRNRFDDRSAVLLNNFNAKIYKVIVYESDKGGLVAAKFYYFNSDNPSELFEGATIVPQAYLQKCRQRIGQLKPPNFFKLFKIKTSAAERRILKIQMVSNSSDRFEFGEKRPFEQMDRQDAVYSFDINITEYPASMFGSALLTNGQQWFMESLGAEVRDSNEHLD